ncbi:hypothetical protein N9Z85_06840, partial [Akkermansiaceae bacterium]|nr:hypothetical protein [Akkermansiaceae bacterium]
MKEISHLKGIFTVNITHQKAREIFQTKEHLSFECYTSMEDEAAKIIARKHGQICFPDLREISDQAAE